MTGAIILTTLTVLFVRWLQQQESAWVQRVLDWFPAILFAYVVPAVVTHLSGWDFSKVYLHTISKDWIIPFTIVTVMSALSIRQLRLVGWKPIALFVSGSLVIAVLPVVLVSIYLVISPEQGQLFITEEFWKGLVPIVGGWIGGSTSQLVLKEVVECPEALFLSILVLDNILVNIWTILMFQIIKRSDQLNAYFGISSSFVDVIPDQLEGEYRSPGSIIRVVVILLATTALCSWLIPSFLWTIIILSIVGLLLGNFLPRWNHSFTIQLGGVLIIIVMAILGLKLDFSHLSLPLALVGLVVIWLLLHFVFMLIVARLLQLHMAWVPIASMANLGGISTAPAVTAAYNEEWMPHAILLAILSMVSGTAWGLFTIALFGLF